MIMLRSDSYPLAASRLLISFFIFHISTFRSALVSSAILTDFMSVQCPGSVEIWWSLFVVYFSRMATLNGG